MTNGPAHSQRQERLPAASRPLSGLSGAAERLVAPVVLSSSRSVRLRPINTGSATNWCVPICAPGSPVRTARVTTPAS